MHQFHLPHPAFCSSARLGLSLALTLRSSAPSWLLALADLLLAQYSCASDRDSLCPRRLPLPLTQHSSASDRVFPCLWLLWQRLSQHALLVLPQGPLMWSTVELWIRCLF